MQKNPNSLDSLVIEFDKALRAITGVTPLRRPIPKVDKTDLVLLSDEQKSHAAGLMRVNHVGEVCAQALYQSQKITSRSSTVKAKLDQVNSQLETNRRQITTLQDKIVSQPADLPVTEASPVPNPVPETSTPPQTAPEEPSTPVIPPVQAKPNQILSVLQAIFNFLVGVKQN